MINALGIVTAAASDMAPDMWSWQWWKDVAAIVGGIGTALLAAASVWITTRERSDRKQAERDRDEARDAQRRAEQAEMRRQREAQARRVVVTMTRIGSVRTDPNKARVACHNYSDMPIMNVTVFVNGQKVKDSYSSVLHPGESRAALFTAQLGEKIHKPEVTARFLDAAGVVWRRAADGSLVEVSNE
jgi:hypothetical protein